MQRRRATLVAIAALAVFAPTDHAGAGVSERTVGELAAVASDLVSDELELLDTNDADPAALRQVDDRGHAALVQLRNLGVQLTPAVESALEQLPSRTTQIAGPPNSPPAAVYLAAIDDLGRMAVDPSTFLPDRGTDPAPSYALVLIAAIALVALGGSALVTALWRRTDEDEIVAETWSDALTGVASRRRLDLDLAAGGGDPRPSAVIVIDIDRHDDIVARHGHDVGDGIIRSVARVIARAVRSDDVVYRSGDRQFCIFLRDTDDQNARRVADRIVSSTREISLPGGLPVTVSAGVAANAGADVAAAVAAADRASACARADGHDRAVHAPGRDLTRA